MRSRAERHKSKASGKQKQVAYGIVIVLAVLLCVTGLKIFSADTKNQIYPQNSMQLASAGIERRADTNNDLWDGPVLYHQAKSEPIDLILVEKATQKLHLVHYGLKLGEVQGILIKLRLYYDRSSFRTVFTHQVQLEYILYSEIESPVEEGFPVLSFKLSSSESKSYLPKR